MNRRKIIKTLLGTAAVGFLPWNLVARPPTKKVYRGYVAGYQYQSSSEYQQLMKAGDPLDLVREPQNFYDNNAIAIFWNGTKLGYIPKKHNLVLKNMIDEGIGLVSIIKTITLVAESWERVEVEVYVNL